METRKQRELIKAIRSAPDLASSFTVPLLALPTLLVFIVSFLGFGLSAYALLSGLASPFITIPIGGFFVFWSFTPLHEAVHRNLSSINWLNDFIGTLSAQLLLPGFSSSLYRFLHVTHHARTGQPDDPDLKFTESNILVCWLNSAFLDVVWARFYFSVWTERPLNERIRFAIGLALYISLLSFAFTSPYAVEFVLAFVLPMFLGRILTVYLFATIQHRLGHEQRIDPIGATSIQDVHSNWWRHLFMLGQSQHLIHHLYPGVPWYKYASIWTKAKQVIPAEIIRPSGYLTRNHNH